MNKTIYEERHGWARRPKSARAKLRKTLEADVVVVGAGLAGVSRGAGRGRAGQHGDPAGKCRTPQARSGDFAVMDSRVAEVWGRREVDKVQIVNDLMRDMAYKASQSILRRWADEAERPLTGTWRGTPHSGGEDHGLGAAPGRGVLAAAPPLPEP